MAKNTERISAQEWNKRMMNGILSGRKLDSMPDCQCTKKVYKHPEEDMQIECVKWFDHAFPCYSFLLFHPANGGSRNSIEAAKLKKMGVRPGIPDLILLLPRKGYSFLSIELKARKQGRQSESQKIIEELIHKKSGGLYILCRSFDEFRRIIENYLHD